MTTLIERKRASLLQQGVDLGPPTSAEEVLADGGRRGCFANGRIYFHPRVGTAFACQGPILSKYIEMGEMQGALGYPASEDEQDPKAAGGHRIRFEGGVLRVDDRANVLRDFADPNLRPHVIVKIVDDLPVSLGAFESLGLADLAAAAGVLGASPAVGLVAELLPDIAFGRAFDPLDPGTLTGMVEQARKRDPDYAPPLLDNFLQVDCPIGFDVDSLAAVLGQWFGVVEYAYAAGEPSDPQVVATGNPLFKGQHHLNAAPEGIGVRAAWDRGLDGSGVMLVDVEQGWFLDHEDLPPGIALIDGANRRESFGHGTAVLSTVIGLDNDRGGVGIAPAADVRVASVRREVPLSVEEQGFNAAGTITNAVAQMPDGSILLLEHQLRGVVNGNDVVLPAESQPAVFEAIRLATALGIVVIEAAGNGGMPLDDFVDRTGRHVLSRDAGPEFADSGAIVVGGCEPETPHRPDTDLNFGSRVDCHAWGSSVLTAGGPFHSEQTDAYFFFNGTSSSAAIVAGVAILVQQMMTEALGRPLTPREMRGILSAPTNGTASTGGAADQIGVMPDLEAIIANELI
jgi:hypothetical protein